MVKKLLVCGGTGFVGRNVSEYFAKKSDFEVYATYFNSKPFDNSKINFVKSDLTEKSDVDESVKGKDIIIQAAAKTSGAKDIFTRPYYHVADNAVMNALLFRSAFEHKIKNFIFLSCLTMYQSSDKAVKETDFNPNDEIHPRYFSSAWTKVYNEKMCKFYSGISDTKYLILRHSNIYGPHDKFDLEKSHVFGATMTKVMKSKEPEKIVVWGEGKEERDLLYIFDLIDFIDLAIKKQKEKYQIYNVGYGSSISIKDLVKKIIDASGKDLKIEFDSTKPSIKTKVFLDTKKAKKDFGWQAKTNLDDGIKKTMKWYKENLL